mmetsp:Transcript_87448/g.152265  ORF Transcript_87448/g.152265 Transcript_87448/m.152265 type:complete len:80 (-) Transcript_87448:433-672(-)
MAAAYDPPLRALHSRQPFSAATAPFLVNEVHSSLSPHWSGVRSRCELVLWRDMVAKPIQRLLVSLVALVDLTSSLTSET